LEDENTRALQAFKASWAHSAHDDGMRRELENAVMGIPLSSSALAGVGD
jgi:hypothetical protein